MPVYVITLNTSVNPPSVSVEMPSAGERSPSATPVSASGTIQQLMAEAQISPPTTATNAGNPVPAGYVAWPSGQPAPSPGGYLYAAGFAGNVRAPYSATDLGAINGTPVILVWAPAGTPYPPSFL